MQNDSPYSRASCCSLNQYTKICMTYRGGKDPSSPELYYDVEKQGQDLAQAPGLGTTIHFLLPSHRPACRLPSSTPEQLLLSISTQPQILLFTILLSLLWPSEFFFKNLFPGIRSVVLAGEAELLHFRPWKYTSAAPPAYSQKGSPYI